MKEIYIQCVLMMADGVMLVSYLFCLKEKLQSGSRKLFGFKCVRYTDV